jgi:branched-chain amino acid transport system ATP-binding protein
MGIQKSKYLLHLPVYSLKSVNKRAEGLLKLIDLWDDRNSEVQHLSYGHQRQLELIMAVACEPKLLLLDEPTAGLSQAETTAMVKLIENLNPDLTILIIEHDMDVAFEIAEQITVLSNGEVLIKGDKETIQASSAVRKVYLGSDWFQTKMESSC